MVYDLNATSSFTTEADTYWSIDEFLFGSQAEDLDLGMKGKEIDGTGFGSDFTNKRVGTRDGQWKVKGHYAGAKGQVNWLLNWRFGRRTPVNSWAALDGLLVGAPALAMPATITDTSVKATLNDSGKFDAQLDARGACDQGFIMATPTTSNVLTTTGTSTIDDSTSLLPNGSYGGALYVFCWDLSGGTAPTIAPKLTHSATSGGTYVDLVTAPTVNTTDKTTWSSYTPIPSTTLINPCVKLAWTTSGTPTTAQVLAIFARRPQRGL